MIETPSPRETASHARRETGDDGCGARKKNAAFPKNKNLRNALRPALIFHTNIDDSVCCHCSFLALSAAGKISVKQ